MVSFTVANQKPPTAKQTSLEDSVVTVICHLECLPNEIALALIPSIALSPLSLFFKVGVAMNVNRLVALSLWYATSLCPPEVEQT